MTEKAFPGKRRQTHLQRAEQTRSYSCCIHRLARNLCEVPASSRERKEDTMKTIKILFTVSMILLLVPSTGVAGDFEWIKDFNIQAEADPSGFRVRLATRFKVGDATIDAVLSNVENPADAYIALRLGEMSRQPTDRVMEAYKSGKGGGWGVIAKNLGIKPGSKEFHALKNSQDLYKGPERDKGKAKGKRK